MPFDHVLYVDGVIRLLLGVCTLVLFLGLAPCAVGHDVEDVGSPSDGTISLSVDGDFVIATPNMINGTVVVPSMRIAGHSKRLPVSPLDISFDTLSGAYKITTSAPVLINNVDVVARLLALERQASHFLIAPPPGYYFPAAACDAECRECVGNKDNCTSCSQTPSPRFLLNNKCVRTCPRGFLGNTTTLTCDKYPTLCKTFIEDQGEEGCASCVPGYRLEGSDCLACNIKNCSNCDTNIAACDRCYGGFVGSSCQACMDLNCAACDVDLRTCKSCFAGFEPNASSVCVPFL